MFFPISRLSWVQTWFWSINNVTFALVGMIAAITEMDRTWYNVQQNFPTQVGLADTRSIYHNFEILF